jgi:hypothetical protein
MGVEFNIESSEFRSAKVLRYLTALDDAWTAHPFSHA